MITGQAIYNVNGPWDLSMKVVLTQVSTSSGQN